MLFGDIYSSSIYVKRKYYSYHLRTLIPTNFPYSYISSIFLLLYFFKQVYSSYKGNFLY